MDVKPSVEIDGVAGRGGGVVFDGGNHYLVLHGWLSEHYFAMFQKEEGRTSDWQFPVMDPGTVAGIVIAVDEDDDHVQLDLPLH
jgi:hypothetical protein